MGSCQQWNIFPLCCQLVQVILQVDDGRQVLMLHAMLPAERDGRIVDILRGQSKMDPFFRRFAAAFFQFVFQKIFNRLYIMIGDVFDLFYFLCVFGTKILYQFLNSHLVRRKTAA